MDFPRFASTTRCTGPALVPALLLLSAAAFAAVGDPQIRTDDPYFPGEGAMSTPAKAVNYAFSVPRGTLGNSERDKLIKLFLWRSEHFSHLQSPEVYNLPGVKPGSGNNTLMVDYDAMRGQFSYGYGLCGTNHAQSRIFAEAAGWQQRRRGLNGDTGNEWFVDGEWRYVNTDQYTLHFLSNSSSAHFASLDQVVSTNHRYVEWNPTIGNGQFLPQANTHGNYQNFNGVTGTVASRSLQWRDYYANVWNIAAASSIKMYGEGYAAMPVVFPLKKGETFTRWLSSSGIVSDLGLSGKAWWGFSAFAGGPRADYSFVQNAPARDEVPGGTEESAKPATYGNGCYDWQPQLANGDYLEGVFAKTGSFAQGGTTALSATSASSLVFHHFTPYTIAGTPADGIDPANAATNGAVLFASTVGSIGVDVSTDAGASWAAAGTLSGASAQLDFTDAVKGRNHYLLRLNFDNGEGLNSLRLRTITMLSQAVYPNLKSGSTTLTYSAGNVGALELSPNLHTAASANSTTGYVQKVADSGNVNGVFYSSGSTYAYQGINNNIPLQLVYKITMPPELAAAGATWKQIFAAADVNVRIPPPAGTYGRIEISSSQSGPWTQVANYTPPADNDLSHFWVYGRSADASNLGGTTYFVRYTTYNGGYTEGVRYLRLYATYSLPAAPASMTVAYAWNNGTDQTHSHNIAAGAASDTWTITTGANITQKKVSFSVPSTPAPGTPPSITTPPQNTTVTAGQAATFTVTASGSATLTYQWQRGTTSIPGATSATYTFTTSATDTGATFRCVVTNGFGSATSSSATLTVTTSGGGGGAGGGSNSAPTITSPASASPASGTIGQPINFSIGATDANGDPLTITWYFNDGLTAVGSSATHVYSAPGTYVVIAVIEDGNGGSLSSSMTLLITPDTTGGGGGGGMDPTGDADLDGVSNGNEVADGTDPNNAASLKKLPLTVTKLKAAVRFNKDLGDSFAFVGVFPETGSGLTPEGQPLKVDVSGATAAFTLDAKGKARAQNGQASLKLKKVRNKVTKATSFAAGAVPFTVKATRGTWRNTWSAAGLMDATLKNASLILPVDVAFNGRVYTAQVPAVYSAKAGTSGKLKQK